MQGIHYENQLLLLKAEISKMLSLVHQLFKMSVQSMEDGDERMAQRVLQLDDEIDDLDRKIEESVYDINARFKPMIKDLRYSTTMLKFSNNLERIADLACNFGKKTIELKGLHKKYDPPRELREMIGLSMDMIKDTFTAFGDRDLELVKDVILRDKKVDNLEIELALKLAELHKSNALSSEEIIIYALIARDVERIADHAKNLCGETYYIETGEEIKPVIKELKKKLAEETGEEA
jgi:phosphate transport system protein